jgi:hypothetical protein
MAQKKLSTKKARQAVVKKKQPKATIVKTENKKAKKNLAQSKTSQKRLVSVAQKLVQKKVTKEKKATQELNKVKQTNPKKVYSRIKQVDSSNPKQLEQNLAQATKVAKTKPEVSKSKHFLSPTKEMLQLFKTAAKEKKKLLQAKTKQINTPNFLSKPDKKWRRYNMDLRIHSPAMNSYFFSSSEDSCTALVRLAKAKGLDVITVTDLYNVNYLEALKKRAMIEGLRIIPGFEFACKLGYCDDLQFLALFPENFSSAQINSILNSLGVASGLAAKINLKINLHLEQIIQVVEGNGGVLIPTHIDKTPIRQETAKILINMFGFHAFDLLYAEDVQFFKTIWPAGEFTFFNFSNSNSLAQIGNRNSSLRMPKEGFEGLKDIVQRRAGNNVM